jgi:enoyl-CoA hydratase/carnithine racemase
MTINRTVKCTMENRVALLTIDRPPLNILPGDSYEELADTVIGLVRRKEARVVVIAGTPKAFISGLDINDINAIETAEENDRFTGQIKNLFRQIENLPRPVIAAIDGNCFGGGLELALSCHIRLAGDTARLALPEINVGTIPGFGGTQRLPRIIGRTRALELILTGRTVSAEEAERIGLVNAVHPSKDLINQTMKLAGEICEKNYQAVEAAMHAIAEGYELELEKAVKVESTYSSSLIGSYNAKEAMAAFFEHRKPVFRDE